MVAMEYLDHDQNPMRGFPRIKAQARKLPAFLSKDEVGKMINIHRTNTVIGIRDRAIVVLLYGTGIRASECATMKECDVDLNNMTIRVVGKGGGERVLPLNPEVAKALRMYRMVRGPIKESDCFFRSRNKKGMSRNAIFERVRATSRKAKINKHVYPHMLRHTFATHLVRSGVGLVTLRDLLGHRQITSTQVYLHTTAEDLRKAASLHPVEALVDRVAELLPNVKLPFQWPPGEHRVAAG
jgi:site-specific recombinase XerD